MDMDYSATDCSAIFAGGVGDALDCEIAYNTIARCGRSGITPRGLKNSDPAQLRARIHHNDIGWCMIQDWDGGGIYWAASDSKWLRVDHNLVHDMYGFINAGIYPDFCRNIMIDHNVVWNADMAIHVQGSHGPDQDRNQDKQVNNTLIYNNTLACLNTNPTGWGPWCIVGGRSDSVTTVVANNVFYLLEAQKTPRYTGIHAETFGKSQQAANLDWDRVAGSATDPMFVDPAAADFRLKSGSPAIDAAEPLTHWTYDGTNVLAQNDPIVGALDVGAYEYGTDQWMAGSTLPEAALAKAPYDICKDTRKLSTLKEEP